MAYAGGVSPFVVSPVVVAALMFGQSLFAPTEHQRESICPPASVREPMREPMLQPASHVRHADVLSLICAEHGCQIVPQGKGKGE